VVVRTSYNLPCVISVRYINMIRDIGAASELVQLQTSG
jgi:hypothetical protein